MPEIDYSAVVTDLKERRGVLDGLISGIELLMGLAPEETAVRPPEFKFRPPVEKSARREKKLRTQGVLANALSIPIAILQALADNPMTSAELGARVLQLRPGTPLKKIHDGCYPLRNTGKIVKNYDGRWRITGNSAEALNGMDAVRASREAKAAVAVVEVSLSELIRQEAARKPRTLLGLTDHIQQLRPSAQRSSIQSLITQQIAANKLHKGGQDPSGAPFVLAVIDGIVQYPNGINGGVHA